jgi:superfamily II DNA or RNA helicase
VTWGFRSLSLEDSYETSTHDLVNDFYAPCLSRSKRYDRASGYFSSALFALLPLGYADFIERGGKIRLLCSPQLTAADYSAIVEANDQKEPIEVLLSSLRTLQNSPNAKMHILLKIFSSLLASGNLEMRIVSTEMTGIFHDKKGIFFDEADDAVSFIGSANETAAAWSGLVNHESIEVFKSFDIGSKNRTESHIQQFEAIWNGQRQGIKPIDVLVAEKDIFEIVEPEPIENILRKIQKEFDPEGSALVEPVRPLLSLRDYQSDVLKNWHLAGDKGVICFATGGGKTITAISAVRDWLDSGKPALILVPTDYLVKQWEKEVSFFLPDAALLLAGGKGNGKDKWQGNLSLFSKPMDSAPIARVIIATYATANSETFREKLVHGSHLLLVADEVHNFGSPQNSEIADWLVNGGALAMSATPERKWDPVGTQKIFDYFGEKLEPKFGIEEALAQGVLCQYDYFYEPISLTEDEDERWESLTQEFARAWLAAGKKMTKKVTDILILRSRIAKAALAKTQVTVEILERDFRPSDRWLVYCESIGHLNEVSEAIQAARIPGLQVLEYHSMNADEHKAAINFLTQTGGVMLAVKCLDEGVNLPRVNKAIIMASSTNPREYIQRRGRVLRTHPEKYAAQIYDLLVFRADGETPSTCSEIERATLFAEMASNKAPYLELDALRQKCNLRQTYPDEIYEDLDSED